MSKNVKVLGMGAIFIVVLMLCVSFGGNAIVDKVANKVIEKLQKEYSPSPYGPGIDPDKLDVISLESKPKEDNKNSWDSFEDIRSN